MKWYDTEYHYLRCNLMICSTPQSVADTQVFGLFVVDIDAVARRDDEPIEQDFLVRSTRLAGPTVYYSGQPTQHPLAASGFWQDIDAFCERVGKTGEYGCRRMSNGRWFVPEHHLRRDAPVLHSRPDIEAAVKQALDDAQVIVELRAMGAMEPSKPPPWKNP